MAPCPPIGLSEKTRMVFSVPDHRGRVSPVSGDARLSFTNAPLVCTSIPVSRKKFLIMAHPPLHGCSRGTGSLHERRPMRPDQIQLCQPVVTNHNSFSVFLRTEGSPIEELPTAPSSILCLEIRLRRMRVHGSSVHGQWITSYRLPLLLHKKEYKYMLPRGVRQIRLEIARQPKYNSPASVI